MNPVLTDKIERMKKIMSSRLEKHCSQVLLERMHGQLDKIVIHGWPMEATLEGIHTALRLFVDEKIADDLNRQLCDLAKT